MSKKDLVKQVIDDLMKEGRDFYELTQGSLSLLERLKGVSKTTIKRAKNEYKQEKIVIRSDYKENILKRKIYKYLERYPKSNLNDLREALPEIAPSKVSEYHQFWKKKRERKKVESTSKPIVVNSRKLKEMVFDFLDKNRGVTTEQLYASFPTANKSSVSSYFGHWKKKQVGHTIAKEGSLFQVIFQYLDKNPEVSKDSIKKTFLDVPMKTIEVYYKLWLKKKSKQEKKSDNVISIQSKQTKISTVGKEKKSTALLSEKKKKITLLSEKKKKKLKSVVNNKTATFVSSEGRKINKRYRTKNKIAPLPESSTKNRHNAAKEFIKDLSKTIERQKITLTALEVERSMIVDNQFKIIDKYKDLSTNELEDIEDFISLYVEGLRKSRQS